MPVSDEYLLEILDDVGLVTPSQVEEARNHAAEDGASIVDTMVRLQMITQAQITQALAAHNGMEVFQFAGSTIPQEVIDSVPRHIAQRYKAVPVYKHEGGTLSIAISDPTNIDTVDALHYALKCHIEPVVASKTEIDEALARYYGGSGESVDQMLHEITEGDIDIGLKAKADDGSGEEGDDAPIIKLVYAMLHNAYKMRASDIHIEPMEKRLRIRFRIDGDLVEVDNPPKRLQASIISRLKIMSNLSISEKRVPQDGRIQVKVGDKDLDLRVSTIPASHGESIVMRVLDKSGLKLGLSQMGFMSDDQATFERLLALPDGIILVTGPTGSGKTTTLYACLNMINRPDKKIITCEDPVEYQLAGINQVAVSDVTGLTFAKALRAMLRQAPNIVMIGEIRDSETASIAINASLTGHLVFSTLHTNDATSAVSRLVDIGIKPFLVASAVRAIQAQRLVRKICQKCKVERSPTEAEIRALRMNDEAARNAVFYKGEGCSDCSGTGLRGRCTVIEIFLVDDNIRKLITSGINATQLRKRAREMGMRTLREDGIRKILAGITTPEEVVATTVADED